MRPESAPDSLHLLRRANQRQRPPPTRQAGNYVHLLASREHRLQPAAAATSAAAAAAAADADATGTRVRHT